METINVNSIKGLFDYPKNIAEGINKVTLQLISKGSTDGAKQIQEAFDHYKIGTKEILRGNLDVAVENNLKGLGNLGMVVFDVAKITAGGIIGSVTLPVTLAAIGIDKSGEAIADKLENSKNNYAKTLSTLFRPVVGKNSDTKLEVYLADCVRTK